MARVVSGFRKTKRSRRSGLSTLAVLLRYTRKVLSYEIGHLPTIRKKKQPSKPQHYLKRDIHRKRLDNPFTKENIFQKFWYQGILAHRYEIASTTLILVVITWFIVVFVKPTLYITRVSVSGTTEIDSSELQTVALDHLSQRNWLFIPKSHRLFLDLDSLRAQILSKYDLEYLRFEPDWTGHILQISLQEKPSLFVYAVQERYFALDRAGSVIRELTEQPDPATLAVPILYEYDSTQMPSVGQRVLDPQFVASIQTLASGLTAFPEIQIHSFRLRVSPQREITIVDEPPTSDTDKANEKNDAEEAFESAAASIAQAKTIEQKVNELKQALESLSIEKLEEGKLDQLLKEQRVYKPTDGYLFKELEIYTKDGWSIKVGHDVFTDATAAERALNIFATLEQSINLKEVREYIDLRVPNRVYYR